MERETFYLKDKDNKGMGKPIEVYEDDNGCYICVSHSKMSDGRYYQIRRNGKTGVLHRYVYENYIGEIGEGLIIRHTCDNDLCVNPNHLLIGTHKDNSRDAFERGRMAVGSRVGGSKLADTTIDEIKDLYFNKKLTQQVIADMYSVHQGMISFIVNKKLWKHVE